MKSSLQTLSQLIDSTDDVIFEPWTSHSKAQVAVRENNLKNIIDKFESFSDQSYYEQLKKIVSSTRKFIEQIVLKSNIFNTFQLSMSQILLAELEWKTKVVKYEPLICLF